MHRLWVVSTMSLTESIFRSIFLLYRRHFKIDSVRPTMYRLAVEGLATCFSENFLLSKLYCLAISLFKWGIIGKKYTTIKGLSRGRSFTI